MTVSTRRMLGAIAGLLIIAASAQSAALANNARAWIVVAIVVLSVVGADALAADRQLMPTRPVVPLTLAATAFATYLCVPETDQFRGVFVVIALAVAADVLLDDGLSEAAIGLVAALVLWAGIDGGVNRQSAFVGALFAWWPVLLVPLLVWVRRGRARPHEPACWAVTLIAAIAACAVARTGGLSDDVGPALLSVLVAVALTGSLGFLLIALGDAYHRPS